MMRSLAVSSLLAIAGAATAQQEGTAQQQGTAQQPAAPPPPQLVVLCAVDQLAAWVFDQGRPFLPPNGGFARLLRDGAQFTNCAYEHACTETAPGHATIGTGVAARVHGIVRNRWFVPGEPGVPYAITVPMPPLADLPEGKDRGPGKLLVPTLASALKAHVPGSFAASVSWKDRSAILMAGGDADIAVWCEASTGRFVTNTAWCDKTPAWLTQFNGEARLDRYHGWQWTRSGPAEAYAGLDDDRPYEARGKPEARVLPRALTGGLAQPGPAFYAELYESPVGNTVVRLAAEAMVRGMGLGSDAVPDLLCVSFSSTDLVGHVFGADSVEARDTLLRLDEELATLLKFLDDVVGAGKWALFLTADHGVGPTPEWAHAAGVDAQRVPTLDTMVKSAATAALAARFGEAPAGRPYVLHVGEYSCVLDHAVLAEVAGVEGPLGGARTVAAALQKVSGVAAAFATADLLANPHPDALQRSLIAALHAERGGDVQFVVKPYWLPMPVNVYAASHGTPHPYDREVVAFAVGPGVPAGTRVGQAITPGFGVLLFAQMLGIPVPNAAPDTLPPGFLDRR